MLKIVKIAFFFVSFEFLFSNKRSYLAFNMYKILYNFIYFFRISLNSSKVHIFQLNANFVGYRKNNRERNQIVHMYAVSYIAVASNHAKLTQQK